MDWAVSYLIEVLAKGSSTPQGLNKLHAKEVTELIEKHLAGGADVNVDQGKLIKYASHIKNLPLFSLAVRYGGDYKCLQARGYLTGLGIEVNQLESRDQLIEYLGIVSVHDE